MKDSKKELIEKLREAGLGILENASEKYPTEVKRLLGVAEKEKVTGNERIGLFPESIAMFALLLQSGFSVEGARAHVEAGFEMAGV